MSAAWSAPPVSDAKGQAALREASNEMPKVARVVGRSIVLFAAVGFTFALADAISESFTERKTPINGFFAGAAAGSLVGLQTKRLDIAAGAALGGGITSAILEFNGPKLVRNTEGMNVRRFGLRKD